MMLKGISLALLAGMILLGCGQQVDPLPTDQLYLTNDFDTYVIDVEPKPYSKSTSVKAPISVIFNRPIQTDRIDNFRFKLIEQTGTEVQGIFQTRDVNGRFVVDFLPQSTLTNGAQVATYLETGTTYFLKLQYLKDLRGNYLPSFMSSFTTVTEVAPQSSFKIVETYPKQIMKAPRSAIALTTNTFSLIFNETIDVDVKDFDANGCSSVALKDAIQIMVSDFTLPWPENDYKYSFREVPWPGRFCLQKAVTEGFNYTAGPNVVTYRANAPFPALSLVKIILNRSDSLRGAVSKETLSDTEYFFFFNVLPDWMLFFGLPALFPNAGTPSF